jgi:DNA-binding CsgD family transcriptional regulator
MVRALQTEQKGLEAALGAAILTCGTPRFEADVWALLRLVSAADNVVAMAYRAATTPLVLFRHASTALAFAQLETSYLAGAYLLDPIHELHLTAVPAGAYRLSDVAPDAFHRSRYFEEYFRTTTILDEVAFIAYPRPGVTVAISLGRDATSGVPFSSKDVEACRRLSPIIVALVQRHWAELPASAGERPDIAARMGQELRQRRGIALTPRQAEVALLILRGHSSMSIALRLGLSQQTIKVFRRQLYRRCGISCQAELFSLLLPHLQEIDSE